MYVCVHDGSIYTARNTFSFICFSQANILIRKVLLNNKESSTENQWINAHHLQVTTATNLCVCVSVCTQAKERDHILDHHFSTYIIPSRGTWWSSTRASGGSCTWEGTTPLTSTGSGLTCCRAALWRGTWVSWWTTSWPWASSVPWLPRRPTVSWGALSRVWPAGQGRFPSASTLPWWDPIWSTLSSSGLPSSGKMRNYCRESSGGLRGWWRGLEHLSYEERLRELQPEEEKAERGPYQCL